MATPSSFLHQIFSLTCAGTISLSLLSSLHEELPFPVKTDPLFVCCIQFLVSCSGLCSCKDIAMSPLSWIIPIKTSTHYRIPILSLNKIYSFNLPPSPTATCALCLPFQQKFLNYLWRPSPLPHLPFFLTCIHLAPVFTSP